MRFLIAVVRALLYGWVLALIYLVRELGRRRLFTPKDYNQLPSPSDCVPIDHPAFVRPDPLIYCQRKLLAEGLAVTWDYPDITLLLNGVPVSSAEFLPSTTYDVHRIWNNSVDAPVVGMQVHFSFLSFGGRAVDRDRQHHRRPRLKGRADQPGQISCGSATRSMDASAYPVLRTTNV